MQKEQIIRQPENVSEQATEPVVKKFRMQFRLRTLGIFVTALSVPMAITGHRIHDSDKEHAIISSIRHKCHRVGSLSGVGWNIRNDPLSYALIWTPGLRTTVPGHYKERTEWLDLDDTTDEDIEKLSQLIQLETLTIYDQRMTEKGVAMLGDMKNLRGLQIHGDFPKEWAELLRTKMGYMEYADSTRWPTEEPDPVYTFHRMRR